MSKFDVYINLFVEEKQGKIKKRNINLKEEHTTICKVIRILFPKDYFSLL